MCCLLHSLVFRSPIPRFTRKEIELQDTTIVKLYIVDDKVVLSKKLCRHVAVVDDWCLVQKEASALTVGGVVDNVCVLGGGVEVR